ncbi:hypothetical protein [Microbacterium rhizosphaerae]|uniref:RiboL-PSP-HEPN domain-containing protein n=2 Tax=Microbacterium rhizosphaerae TaxID=1678237 RepID=A0ABZ0SN67_9MICO|nr:hypothetical protein [Microbacterium rhizosphaerae]WPR90250.1 hypothetical protein SM116_02900 [Microbacterium rhizosphaerae]
MDASDLFRGALVQAVAAMDHYFHGVVLDRGVDMLLGRAVISGFHRTIGLQFGSVRDIVTAITPGDQELEARKHIAARLGKETFQSPDDIASALALVGVTGVWKTAFGNGAGAVKTSLGLVVTRRNRIVHQADSDPLNPGVVTPLSAIDALDAISTVESTVQTIDSYC